MRKIKHGRLAGGCSDACCLKLEGLSVHIQGEDILEDVSFHLHCGEIAALIGPNGAGKSSLFRSILGQMPYSGTITFSPAGGPAVRLSDGANAPLAARGTRPLIGYVPQSPSFDRGDPVSVLDFFTAATSKWPVFLPIPREYRDRAAAILARVHGEALLHKRIGTLSGGELQRFCIARALGPRTRYLLCDEITAMLDLITQAQIWQFLLEEAQRRELGLLVVSHNSTLLERICSRIVTLPPLRVP